MSNESTLIPIRELSARTGVNSVTLRAWERRYGLLKPQRTEKGHRLYSEDDIARVQAVLLWMSRGVAVGKVKALLEQGNELNGLGDDWLPQREQLLEAVRSCHEMRVDAQFQQLTKEYPAEIVASNWLLPVLEQLEMSESNRAAFHYLSALMRARIQSRVVHHNQQCQTGPVLLIEQPGGNNWRLWLVALALLDGEHPIQILSSDCEPGAWSSLISMTGASALVGYREDKWLASQWSEINWLAQCTGVPIVLAGAGSWLTAEKGTLQDQFFQTLLQPLDVIACLQAQLPGT